MSDYQLHTAELKDKVMKAYYELPRGGSGRICKDGLDGICRRYGVKKRTLYQWINAAGKVTRGKNARGKVV